MLELQFHQDPKDSASDRRTHPRVGVNRPCKVHDPRTGKYYAARTHDLSHGGVMVEIDRPLDIKPGEELYIGVAQKRRQMLLRSQEMIRLRVVRALGTLNGGTMLAGCWDEEIAPPGQLRQAA